MRLYLTVVAVAGLAAAGCGEGAIGASTPTQAFRAPGGFLPATPGARAPATGGPSEPGSGAREAGAPSAAPSSEGFDVETERLEMLPFAARMDRLAHTLGVDRQDPVFDPVYARRLELGDHDYAAGYQPTSLWNATRMTIWVDALQPVCRSNTFRAAFDLPSDLLRLVETAYGRRVPAEELADYEDLDMVPTELIPETLCLSVLSSAEFVLR